MITTNYFRRRREELGLTQRAIADVLGQTPQMVSNWELGKSYPHHSDYARVAAAYGTDAETLAVEIARISSQASSVTTATAPAA